MTDDPVIFMEHVRFSYDSAPVLEDVNLAIAEKELTWIVGPNGGGKTTLIKLILGLLHPSKGIIRVFGGTPESARSRIGYMPQYTRFDPRFPISAREVVLMGRLGSGFKFGRFGRNDLRAAEEALEMVRLAEVRD
ncbi:MAG: ATP-binding cassette domain-containing protein, partial [Candidatus Zixiibacteriota bacterium]